MGAKPPLTNKSISHLGKVAIISCTSGWLMISNLGLGLQIRIF
jgi:hypothetical protein